MPSWSRCRGVAARFDIWFYDKDERLALEALAWAYAQPVDLIMSNEKFRASQGFRAAALRLATEKKLTVREVLYRNGGGHRQIVGTPEQAAKMIESWWRDGAVDGFNLMIDVVPSGLEAFVEHVVPILQKRGIFQSEYSGNTLRDNLGIAHKAVKAA